jgi:hypothetical protein
VSFSFQNGWRRLSCRRNFSGRGLFVLCDSIFAAINFVAREAIIFGLDFVFAAVAGSDVPGQIEINYGRDR